MKKTKEQPDQWKHTYKTGTKMYERDRREPPGTTAPMVIKQGLLSQVVLLRLSLLLHISLF